MPRPPRPKIQVLRSEMLLKELELFDDRPLLVGRSHEADFTIDHRSVSPLHASLEVEDGYVVVEDLDSEHGSFIGGRRIAGRVRMRHGETLLLGQHANVGPVLLRLEDAADELLSSLGVLAAEPAAGEAADPGDGETAGELAGPGAGFELGEWGGAELVPSPASGEPAPRPADRPLAVAKSAATARSAFSRLWPAALPLSLSAACILALWSFLGFMRPTATEWRAVQLRPSYLASAGLVTLLSPDIDAWTELAATVDGRPAEIVSQAAGELVVEVPEIDRPVGGVHAVGLQVVAASPAGGGEPIFERRVSYVVHPRPTGFAFGAVEEGRLFDIEGERLQISGGAASGGAVDVLVEGQPAQIREASSGRLTVRMPELGLDGERPVEVVLTLGGLRIPVPGELLARPREADPLAFTLSPTWDGPGTRWTFHHPFGVAFQVVGSPPGPSGEVPQAVARIVARWDDLIAAAAADPAVRVEAFAGGRRVGLRWRGDGRPRTLVSWPRGQLSALDAAAGGVIAEQVRCHHLAAASNRVLDVFARGLRPATSAAGEAGLAQDAVLADLVDASLAGGFDGVPDGYDLDALGGDQLDVLAGLFETSEPWISPTGRWNLLLENVFVPEQDYRVEMAAELDADGHRLAGTVTVVLRSDSMTFGEWTAPIEGRIELGDAPRVRLETTLSRPLGALVLEGRLEDGVLVGDFTVDGEQRARWQGRRLPADRRDASATARAWGRLG